MCSFLNGYFADVTKSRDMRVTKYADKKDIFQATCVQGNNTLEKALGAFEHLTLQLKRGSSLLLSSHNSVMPRVR